jgi:hypothetical protein
VYDEEFDWANPNYLFQHPAQLVEGHSQFGKSSELKSWVEDYWLELAQLAWNGYNEGYRGIILAMSRTAPCELQSLENWLTDPKIPSFMGFRDVWYSPWFNGKVPEKLFQDPCLRRKVSCYDPKAQLVIAFLDGDQECQGHYIAYCQDAYPMNAKECSDRSLHHIISKYGAR